MRARLIVILLSFTFVVGCQKSAANLPAPSSESVQITSAYPAVVEVILPGGEGLCSGTFVSPRAVLTAAHCALNDGTYTINASFGTFTTANHIKLGAGVVDDPNDIALIYFTTNIADPNQGQVMNIGSSVHEGDTARLIGYGCTNISTRTGAGLKRTGTNVVDTIDDYINFLTPTDSTTGGDSQALVGAVNRAGSCFGDSGGPAALDNGTSLALVGVTHAGGTDSDGIVSEYVDMTRSDNRAFISSQNSALGLGIIGF